MRILMLKAAIAALLLATLDVAASPLQAPSTASAPANTASSGTFTREELDQMMAPIALYPDALLAQVLMASTYPGDVADAVAWSKAHKDAKGEDAVKQVASESWDPSVQSLVAFPQLLAVLGQDPKWVQRMGDAFLAQPDAVMESVQRLRAQADAAGNLKSNEQQKVTKQAAPASSTTTAPGTQTIVIESSQPDVVYVPSYNPSVVYGAWAYPSYPPYYYPPPAYYYPGGALLSFGIGVAVGGALWGDLDWGHGDIDIDVNRYNEFNRNTNRERNVNRDGTRGDQIGRDGKWQHNAANRDGVPYRDGKSREQYGRQLDGAGQRDAARGRDPARNAERDRARQSMQQRGFEAPAASNREAQQRAGQASRDFDRSGGQNRAAQNSGAFQQRGGQNNAQARQGARDNAGMNRGSQGNAFSGAGNPGQSRGDAGRGQRSMQQSQRPAASRGGGHQMSRPSRPPSRGGGGRRR